LGNYLSGALVRNEGPELTFKKTPERDYLDGGKKGRSRKRASLGIVAGRWIVEVKQGEGEKRVPFTSIVRGVHN